MKIDTLPIGLYEENSYVLHDQDHVLLIDPGRYGEKIAACIHPEEKVDGIVLTHGHADHVGAVDDLADRFGCPVYLNAKDWDLVSPDHRSQGFEKPIYHSLLDIREGEKKIGSFVLQVMETPGHTPGSVLIQYRNVLFTGDTLFAGSIGRTDLFGGDDQAMRDTLHRLMTLNNDLVVYPGHGPATLMAREKKMNPYLVYGNPAL
jgi:hydroxyacylglutathione hydrolase